MTESPYLERATQMDALAVDVGTTLINSLTLLHGGALITIPTFPDKWQEILQSSDRNWILAFLMVGLITAIGAGIAGLLALAQRSGENLELARPEPSEAAVAAFHAKYLRRRRVGIDLIVVSTLCLVLASLTGFLTVLRSA